MKIASHVLLYNTEKWIFDYLDAVAPHVDKIYAAWSEFPWTYNKNAREIFRNKLNPEILKKSPHYNKIHLIKGTWDKDEDQRNACRDAAIKDGMDYLLIIDADEFYRNSDMNKIIKTIKENPDYDYYTTPWITFWKDWKHVIVHKNETLICGYPEIALNLKKSNKFIRCRRPSGSKVYQMDALCHHGSYVLTDAECWEKINTWGHSHQFNTKKWFDSKWKNWNLQTQKLHPIVPTEWLRARKYDDNQKLPEVLNKLK